MNRLIRGRIRDGAWVDQQMLWQADMETYTDTTDLAAGGRIAFDDSGHVFFSVGMKAPLEFMGIQDLSLPYGKIHRVHDDGRIPADNPFVEHAGRDEVDLDLRAPQRPGAGVQHRRRARPGAPRWARAAATNSIACGPGATTAGRLFTNGVNYDGRPVDVGRALGITLDAKDAEFPVVDMTPAQAISSFVFYRGKAFPGWKDNIIVGTLRATDLLRMEIVDNQVVHTEILLKDLARFRDIEVGPKGELYVLLENAAGSRIIRLVPE